MSRVTQEQKDIAKSVDIMGFINREEDYYLDDEESQAILNNVPGNTEIEEINHLNEMALIARNWTKKERDVVIDNLPLIEMIDVIRRKVDIMQIFIRNQRNNVGTLDEVNI